MNFIKTILYNSWAGRNILRPVFVLPCIVISFLGMESCGSGNGGDNGDDFNRALLLENWCDNIIIPSYEDYNSSTEALKVATDAYSLDPTNEEAFNACIDAFEVAYFKWQSVAPFDFGPAIQKTLLESTNKFPTDIDDIEAAILNPDFTPGLPSTLDNIGLPAIDYLLNSENAFANLSNDAERVAHLERLVDHLHEKSSDVLAAWTSGYAMTFKSATGTEVGSSLEQVVNAFNRVYEANVRKQKLGLPSGIMTITGTELPGHVEALYSNELSVDLLHNAIVAFENFYLGNYTADNGTTVEGLGLDDYLISFGNEVYGSELNTDIVNQLSLMKEAVLTLESPLSEYVLSNPAETAAVFTQLQAIVVLWKVDMMSSLGIMISYTDNDGD